VAATLEDRLSVVVSTVKDERGLESDTWAKRWFASLLLVVPHAEESYEEVSFAS